MKILFMGDYHPGNLEEEIFDDSIIDLIKDNFSIINLESPILKSELKKREKSGPHLFSSEFSINYLKTLNVDLACLANNHICDYGSQGINETVNILSNNNVNITGLNNDPYEINDELSVLNICENEWVNCNSNFGTVNNYSHSVYSNIVNEKNKNRKVIIIYHGGEENLETPSPKMVERLRSFIDLGADFIVSHHTHKISGWEVYKDKFIFYGLGNFYFSNESAVSHSYERGLVVEVSKDLKNFTLHFVEKRNKVLYVLKDRSEVSLMNKSLLKINNLISSPENLKKYWLAYCEKNKLNTICEVYFSFLPRPLNYFLKKSGLLRFLISKTKIRTLINLVRSESHSEKVIDTLNLFK